MNEIDQTLDAMTPEELTALETEVDSKLGEKQAKVLFAMGAKMAREQVEHFQKTGEILPALALAHAVSQPKTASDDEILDKCSAEELAAIEAELDSRIEKKASEEYAAEYFDMGRKLARKMAQDMKKSAAAIKATKIAPTPSMGARVGGFIDKHPLASGAIAGVIGSKLLDDRK